MSMKLPAKRKPLPLWQEDSKPRRPLMEEPHPLTRQKREALKKARKNKELIDNDLYA